MATTTQPEQTSELVGILPQTAPAPRPPRRIAFLNALFCFWLRPKKLGADVIAGTTRRALLAHAICMIVALIAAAIIFLVIRNNASEIPAGLPAFETVQWVLTGIVMRVAAESTQSGTNSTVAAGLTIGSLPLLEVAIVLSAVLLMPHIAGGDKTSSVFARSFRSVLWATTILLPLSLVAVATAFAAKSHTPHLMRLIDIDCLYTGYAIGCLLIILAIRAALVAGNQYVGPATGPAFAEREPYCEICGYIIFSLPIAARCPECGTAIADSLPGGRRKPTLWQDQGIRLRGVLDLIRLHAAVLFSVKPLTRIPVHSAMKAARHFWWVSYAMMVLVLLALLRVAANFEPTSQGLLLNMAPVSITIALIPFALQAILTLAASLWSQFRHGIRDYRVSAIICCYACPLQWPVLIVVLAATCLLASGYAQQLRRTYIGTFFGINIDGSLLVIVIAGLFTLIGLLFWFRRLLAALWAARFSNV